MNSDLQKGILEYLAEDADRYIDVNSFTPSLGAQQSELDAAFKTLAETNKIKSVTTDNKIIQARISNLGIKFLRDIETRDENAAKTRNKLFWWLMSVLGAVVAGLILYKYFGVGK